MDLYRVCAVGLVVMGHWLAASISYRQGRLGWENPLSELPWTQWLTWIFQTVPVLFLAAGYAGAASRTRHQNSPYGEWLGQRFRTVLGPTTAYVATVLAVVAIVAGAGVHGSALELGGWAVAMHLWFIPVYLVVVALTPVSVSLQRRWGLRVALALASAVAAVDAVSVSGLLPGVGWLNNILCWLVFFQLGVAWYFGSVGTARAVALALAAGVGAVGALTFGPYPVALISVPGQVVQNSAPPSVVMLAVGVMQAGVLIAIAPAVTRWLRGSRLRRSLTQLNSRIMAVYLWHMIAVVTVALVAYPRGWLPMPALGTGAWWLSRALWVTVLAIITAVVLLAVIAAVPVLTARLASMRIDLPAESESLLLLVGTGAMSIALWMFSVTGFAPGTRFPAATAALYVGGVAVAVLHPTGRRNPASIRNSGDRDAAPRPDPMRQVQR